MAKPAVLIAQARSGSTYLSYGLDNHPDVFWPRHEPMSWLPGDNVEKISLVHSAMFYKVSGLKLIFRRLMNVKNKSVWHYLRATQVKCLWLYRENTLATALSGRLKVKRKRNDYQAHYTGSGTRPSFVLSPESVLRALDVAETWKERLLTRVRDEHLPSLLLSYESIKGDDDSSVIPPPASCDICDFLGVRKMPIETGMQRACKGGHKQYIKNWHEIKTFVVEGGYEHYLEGIQ